VARVEPETFARSASLALSLDDWLRLARRINQLSAEPDLAGVVVTVGTDTLEELAWFLDLTVRGPVPVVVTGAIRKPGGPQSDGPANLLEAVRVACTRSARGRGTLVVFHGMIFPARDVVKTSTVSADAFGGSTGGPIGRVYGTDVRLDDPDPRRHGTRSEFDVTRITQLARVDVLLTYQQAPGDLITAAVRNGARGLVMAAAGAGALSASELYSVTGALSSGVTIFLVF
jgi:L-asparaginase